jgi:ribose transport system permease protein
MKNDIVLKWLNRFGLLFALLAIYLLFVCIAPSSFSTVRNLETIARQTVIVGIAAIGMTFVIISGGIDLSVGSIVAFSSVLVAYFLNNLHFSPFPSALCAVVIGSLLGLLTGFLITRLKVVPFIVTLGMMLLCRGVAKGLADEQKINAPYTWLNEILASLPPERSWMILSPGVWVFIALALLFAFVLRYTVFGRATVAIGSNELTARLCGIAVEKTKVVIYIFSALFASIAGVMQFSRLTVGDPTVAVGLELDVIAAVVIGGASLSGGQGTIFGSLIGALIMTIIRSGCTQMGLANWIQEIVTGAIIIIAVALDRLRHRKS